MSYFSHNLKDDEEVVLLLRKHGVTFLKVLIITIVILIVPLWPQVFAYLLSTSIGAIIFFVWVAVGIFFFFYQWFVWYFDVFIITDQRVIDIDQRSIFNRKVSEVYLTNIQDVSYHVAGFWATVFNYGTISIHSAGSGQAADLNKVGNPEKVQELIVELQQLARKKQDQDKAQPDAKPVESPKQKKPEKSKSDKNISTRELIEQITSSDGDDGQKVPRLKKRQGSKQIASNQEAKKKQPSRPENDRAMDIERPKPEEPENRPK